jgi:hypothetical protein
MGILYTAHIMLPVRRAWKYECHAPLERYGAQNGWSWRKLQSMSARGWYVCVPAYAVRI